MHPDVAALLAVQDDDLVDPRARDAARRVAAAPRRDGVGARQGARGARSRRRQIAGAEERRRHEVAGACRAAPSAAGEEPGGAEQRDVDARSDRRDGAARAGQANDRRGRARARRRSASGSARRIAWSTSASASPPSSRRRRPQARDVARRRPAANRGRARRRAQRSRSTRRRTCRARCSSQYDRIRIAQARPRGVSAARQLVRQLRHGDSAAAAQQMVGTGRDGDLRRMRRAAVRGGLMIVGRRAPTAIAFARDRIRRCALAPSARWLLPTRAGSRGVVERLSATSCTCPTRDLPPARRRAASARRTTRRRISARASISCTTPNCLIDLDRAVERLARALREGETILVHGDYDVDGICSTTLLTRALRALGGNAVPFIPRRLEDGYDLTRRRRARGAARRARRSSSPATAARARSRPSRDAAGAGSTSSSPTTTCRAAPLPNAYAVLNPEAAGLRVAGQGSRRGRRRVQARARAHARARRERERRLRHARPRRARDDRRHRAAARRESRLRRATGSSCSTRRRTSGLRALIRAAGLEGKPLTAGRVGFILAPRLNAVGPPRARAARRRAADGDERARGESRSRASSRS